MRNRLIHIEEMLTDQGAENELREVPLSKTAFHTSVICACILLGVVFIQFLNVGLGDHARYTARADENMSETRIISAPRGIIEDRFGKPIVTNIPSVEAYLIPHNLPRLYSERKEALRILSEITGLSEEELYKKFIARDWSLSDRFFLTNNLPETTIINLTRTPLPYIELQNGFERTEMHPLAFAHVVGYTGRVDKKDLETHRELVIDDTIGKDGLEAYYDENIRGKNGEHLTLLSAKGIIQEERTEKTAQPGNNLRTFIDADFQVYLYERLARALKELGRDAAVAIAMNPQNGEVLALVSMPSFEVGRISMYLNRPSNPLFNRAVSGLYNPGSTIKPLVGTAALTEKVIMPNDKIFSRGYIEIPNPYNPDAPSRFVDWRPNGWVDIEDALAKSSNIYFYEVGGGFEHQKGLGIARLKEWWQKFNLDMPSQIDLLGEQKGFLPDPEWKKEKTGTPWRIGDTYNVSIGQGDFSITPIGLLNYINAIANGGTLYMPRIMASVESTKDKKRASFTQPVVLKDVREEIKGAIPHIQQGMRSVVEKSYGSAHILNDLPFHVSGKTGTAQTNLNTKLNAFFVGFAPSENPQIAILVLVENAKEGSLNALPVAKDALLWYYEHRLK